MCAPRRSAPAGCPPAENLHAAFAGSNTRTLPMAFASKRREFLLPKKAEEDRPVLRLFREHSRLRAGRNGSVRALLDKKRPFGLLLDTPQATLGATMSRAIPRIKEGFLFLRI